MSVADSTSPVRELYLGRRVRYGYYGGTWEVVNVMDTDWLILRPVDPPVDSQFPYSCTVRAHNVDLLPGEN